MPVKDLSGKPSPTKEQRALIAEIHMRLGLRPPRRGGSDDDGLVPVPPSPGPGSGPSPLAGAATID